jgi:hypothetical protein
MPGRTTLLLEESSFNRVIRLAERVQGTVPHMVDVLGDLTLPLHPK